MLSRKNMEVEGGRKPAWLRVRAPGGEAYARVKAHLHQRNLHSVCEEARCPNIGECWHAGTATFMLLGDTCTRACAFCAVKTGNPRGAVDPDEPRKLAESVAGLGLHYVVLTTVDRDDLADGGAAHMAAAIRAIKALSPGILVEVLTGDYRGESAAIRTVVAAAPDVFAHNVETVERLTPVVRDRRASYATSLAVLAEARRIAPSIPTKSSVMVGLGESEDEIVATLRDLRSHGVELLTLGQYLRPSPRHLPVVEYVEPERFERLRRIGLDLGFTFVASGPLVRSSYRAGEHFIAGRLRRGGDPGAESPGLAIHGNPNHSKDDG